MLDIVLFVLTSSPANLPMRPSINEVKSVAMSNLDGVTPNHLSQQVYGTQVLDDDVDLELSDEQLELIAVAADVDSPHSDVFYRGQKRIDYDSFLEFQKGEPNEWNQISYICKAFSDVLNCDRQSHDFNVVAAEIWQQLRNPTAVLVKRAHNGFTVNLKTGKLTFRR